MSKNIKTTFQALQFDERSTNWESFDADIDHQSIFQVDQQTYKTIRNLTMHQQLQDLDIMDSKTKKRQKKKQYKRRRRERQKLHEKQAFIELAEIIEQIYRLQTSFQLNKSKIQICLSYLDSGDKFNDFLAQVIKSHVQCIQQELLDSTHQIILMNLEQQRDIQTLDFYDQIATRLYRQYVCIQQSTQEIKKIIRLYKNMHNIFDNEMREYNDLDKSTFSYLINSDDSIKHQVRLCQKKLKASKKQKLLPEAKKFLMLLQVLDIDLTTLDNDCLNQQSTSIDQQEQIIESKTNKKKNRKKKVKQSDLNSQYADIMNRLQCMTLGDERSPCHVSQQWLDILNKSCHEMVNH